MEFILTYNNGTTITESQKNWDECDKQNVTSLSIKDDKGVLHTLSIPENYKGIFQHKVRHAMLGHNFVSETIKIKFPELRNSTEIGVVNNSNGDCIILKVFDKEGQSKVYLDNVKNMGLNLRLHNIKLRGGN